jgi:hypothetical protein
MLLGKIDYARVHRSYEGPHTFPRPSISTGTEAQVLSQSSSHDFGCSATRFTRSTFERRG